MIISRYLPLLTALFFSSIANAQNLNAAQIKQIEEIAHNIAAESNANKQSLWAEMSVSITSYV